MYVAIPLLAGCAPKVTPGQLEAEFCAEVKPDGYIREVEAFLEAREMSYTRQAIERTGILYASIRKPSIWRTCDGCWSFSSRQDISKST